MVVKIRMTQRANGTFSLPVCILWVVELIYRFTSLRDAARKTGHDPLTSINHQLSSQDTSSSSAQNYDRFKKPEPPQRAKYASAVSSNVKNEPSQVQARLSRESSERERALALIRRKRREMMGSETPSTVHGGMEDGYGDIFNKKEVEEARRRRERREPVYWDERESVSAQRGSSSRRW